MDNKLFLNIDDELIDINAGGIAEWIGYWTGRIFGEVVETVGNTKWHPYGPCDQKGCCIK